MAAVSQPELRKGLLNQPAGMFVRIINAVPQGVVNVLQARVRAQS